MRRPAAPRTLLILLLLPLSLAGCRDFIIARIVREQEDYLEPEGTSGIELTKLTERAYTFRWRWYRNLVVKTDEGWFLTDPFHAEAAGALAKALREIDPDLPIHTLFYTHYHLDHVGGGAVLGARNVLAHEKCPSYWNDVRELNPEFWSARMVSFAEPTRGIAGDQTLTLGGVEIQLLYLGKTHSDTLYAVYLPGERLLFTADFGLIRTIPPLGGPDFYVPGALRAMRRLAALDFDVFVPSHFAYGKKADFVESLGFLEDLQRLTREAIDAHAGGKAALPTDADTIEAMFFSVYEPMKEKYGDWHGFEQQILFAQARHLVGVSLGY